MELIHAEEKYLGRKIIEADLLREKFFIKFEDGASITIQDVSPKHPELSKFVVSCDLDPSYLINRYFQSFNRRVSTRLLNRHYRCYVKIQTDDDEVSVIFEKISFGAGDIEFNIQVEEPHDD